MNIGAGGINRYTVIQNKPLKQATKAKTGSINISIGGTEDKNAISSKIESIRNKLNSGKELTPKEKIFLKEHDPELYKKVMKLDMERERYRLELQACQSKEDAQRLHSMKTISCIRGMKQGDEFSYFLYKALEDEYNKYLNDSAIPK